jgi:hypothetical protein
LEAGVIREILLLCDQTAEGKLRELVERAFGRH